MKTIPRRIVTGIQNGKSIIEKDALVTNVSEHFPGLIISDIWSTDCMPVLLNEEKVIENTAFPHTPENGSYFRYVQIPPDASLGIVAHKGEPHPLMHQTDTLDYIVILSGEIYLIVDEGETLLQAGDIVVQRGTNHAWSNRSELPCIQLAVLLDAGAYKKP
ncbi:cupin domain-containing protein [Flavobacterium collinsii]|jgi:quercetin dioxygenase-like cupin family protein|uniref:Cupin_2 domain-containing protein n=1 Tax=Flavobacterium collinsii TaxID=1114861 RepID=A0A9W4X4G4_9FLAO|nr:cupin domain-containing protein [Flavobacterium collinsii]GIQ61330.1 cupin [Flavobacterium collinsii]CAI2768431.1 Cupin_2 domain-containing protein [Flavobacterium collinsii]